MAPDIVSWYFKDFLAMIWAVRTNVNQKAPEGCFDSSTNVLQFCVNSWVIFGHFGKEVVKGWRFDGFGKLKFEVEN